MQITPFGSLDTQPVHLYTLTNAHGLVLKVTDFGATITELWVPDRQGKLADVVLGFDDLAGYRAGSQFFGAIVGRVANRIRDAKFTLEGKSYALEASDPPHSLHGGFIGFHKVLWSAEPSESERGPSLLLRYVSPAGEAGYPGTLRASVRYTLTQDDAVELTMTAESDALTLANLAQHAYFNLGGAGDVLGHELTLFAHAYTPGDPMVPTGSVVQVAGTPFDFTQPKPIGRDLKSLDNHPVGYDHNFVVDGEPRALRPVAKLREPSSGRVLALSADQPGVQFYSGNFLDGSAQGKGTRYAQYSGLCLETQAFPNAINVPAWREQVVLAPGQSYRHCMVYRFSVE